MAASVLQPLADALQPLQDFVHTSPWYLSLLLGLGAFGAGRFALQTLSVLVQTFVLPGMSLKKFGAHKGAWAVVTGASDGIGREFALQLAGRGFNVLLVARNGEKLGKVGEEIREWFLFLLCFNYSVIFPLHFFLADTDAWTRTDAKYPGVQTRVHTIDFAAADEGAYVELAGAVGALDVGVLVNNVGKSHAMPAYLVDTPVAEMTDIVRINVGATVRVTHAVLPGMVRRRRGLVLNIGSFAGAVPSPMLATYSGTKAFLATFTSALQEEVRAHNVVVEHVNTYFVVSKLSKIRRASVMIPTPAAYVRAVLGKIGLGCGAAYSGRPGTSTPFWTHGLFEYVLCVLGMPSVYISYTHALHKSIRRRALKKLEKES
ncbi:3-ketoacyl-CoA reductase [Mycena rebaudengoi]|nr:3-ketoacyl-CoA reductase [Mycena rebaudengoi]